MLIEILILIPFLAGASLLSYLIANKIKEKIIKKKLKKILNNNENIDWSEVNVILLNKKKDSNEI